MNSDRLNSQAEKLLKFYIESKFFKGNLVILLHPFNPSLAEGALKKCENVLFLADQESKTQLEMLVLKYRNGDIALLETIPTRASSWADRILLILGPENNSKKTIASRVETAIRTLATVSGAISKFVALLPPDFEIRSLDNVMTFENRMFYLSFENEKWLDKILDPENYTYAKSRTPKK